MAKTVASDAIALQKQEAQFYLETTRASGFAPYMGTGSGSVIKRKEDLMSNGESITVPLVLSLTDSAIGTGTLEGNEEAIKNAGHRCVPVWHRKATQVPKSEQHKTLIDLYKAQRDVLGDWRVHRQRNQIIEAMCGVVNQTDPVSEDNAVGAQLNFIFGSAAAASDAQMDTWYAANYAKKRVVLPPTAPGAGAVFKTDLAALAATDVMTPEYGRLLKREARVRVPAATVADSRWQVRPIRKDGYAKEYYVCFLGPAGFAQIAGSDEMKQANRDARPREVSSNPLFQDGDMLLNGIIYREIPEIESYALLAQADTGNASVDVEPVFFCGAEALAHAVGQRPRATRSSSDDYGFLKGVGTEELFSMDKCIYEGIQHGIVNGFVAHV